MSKRNVYKGHRYVPKIMGEWNQEETYEGLSIVTNKGTSYTSKKRVPVGIDILDEEYWVVTGNYNAQVENYRQEVKDYKQEITEQVDDFSKNFTAQLAQTDTDLYYRGINVLNPPEPLEPMKADGTDETDKLNAIFQYCIDNKKTMIIPETQTPYLVNKFNGRGGVDVIGIGKPQIDITFIDGVTIVPTLGFGSNTTVENIYFNNTVADIEWNRGDLANRSHVKLINCKIEGMQHGNNPGDSNSWGVYLDNTHDIDIINCEFENNTQSDIAIVENCYNINIVKPKGSKLHINIEPNTGGTIYNVTIEGGIIKQLRLLENSFLTTTIRNMTVLNAKIERLSYKGSAVEFIGCEILNSFPPGTSALWGGEVEFNGSIRTSEPLISDPLIADIGNSESDNTEWYMGYTPFSGNIQRMGNFLVLNPTHYNTVVQIQTKKKPVKANKDYMIEIESYAKYLANSIFISQQARVYYYDGSGLLLGDRMISINKSSSDSQTPLSVERVLLKTPENTTHISILLGNVTPNATSTSLLAIKSIQMYELTFGYRTNKPTPVIQHRFKNTKPTSIHAFGGSGVLSTKGTIIYNKNPQSGDFIGWVCTKEGNPGEWKGFGLIE